jgi:hypothetical protein
MEKGQKDTLDPFSSGVGGHREQGSYLKGLIIKISTASVEEFSIHV